MRLSAGRRKRGEAALVAATRRGSQRWGASSGVAGDGDGRGPDDRAADTPLSCFGGGGISSRPPSIVTDPWTAMARTVSANTSGTRGDGTGYKSYQDSLNLIIFVFGWAT